MLTARGQSIKVGVKSLHTSSFISLQDLAEKAFAIVLHAYLADEGLVATLSETRAHLACWSRNARIGHASGDAVSQQPERGREG